MRTEYSPQRHGPCAFYFVEIRSVFCLYLHSGLDFFCSSDPSFHGNMLTSLYLKSETFGHEQLCDYSFIHTIYKFHGMVLVGNLQ